MKMNCDMARDLMPLVIDQVASDASRQAVSEHLAECEECKRLMEDMRKEPAVAAPDGPEDSRFIRLCRKVERRFRWRLAAVIAASALAIALLAATYGYMNSRDADIPYSPDQVFFFLSDQGFLTASYPVPAGQGGWRLYADRASGKTVVTISPQQSLFSRLLGLRKEYQAETVYRDIRLVDGRLKLHSYEWRMEENEETGMTESGWALTDTEPIGELWFGAEETKFLVYRDGDPIRFPPLSIQPGEAIDAEIEPNG